MTDHGQQFGREEFLRYGRDSQQLRERELASPGGPLPGVVLDVPEHRGGGAGHVRPGTGGPVGGIDRASAAAAAEDAVSPDPGPVVDSGGSGAEIGVHRRPSTGRHHRLRRVRVGPRLGTQEASGPHDGEASRPQDRAQRYAHPWRTTRRGGPVDMEHFPRRSARPETGLTESVPCPEPGVPGGIAEKARRPCGSPPRDVAEAPDVAEAIGLRRSGGSSGGRG
ncbi:hypothetical protein [Streptomyces sp. NPDC001750]|uniref:hypothetical protein n=1 Tax=Streptomyces sp. NPDC001750 TaxID=3364607 RepID=UPI0036A65B21